MGLTSVRMQVANFAAPDIAEELLCLDPLKRELLPIPMILAACGEAALTPPSPRGARVAPCA